MRPAQVVIVEGAAKEGTTGPSPPVATRQREPRARSGSGSQRRFDTTYADLVTPEGLKEIATYADAIGAHKDLALPRNSTGETTERSRVVEDAHGSGLQVRVRTMRDENMFMARTFWNGTDPTAEGNAVAECKAFFDAGVDGVFSDHPDTAIEAREQWLDQAPSAKGRQDAGH